MTTPNSDNTVVFKSVEPFFSKEEKGIKPNTVREIDMSDRRFLKLVKWYGYGRENIFIKIVNATDSPGLVDESFTREIQDISFYKNLCIISWVHV